MELYLSGKYRTLIVKMEGELDHHAAGIIRKNVDREIARSGAVNVAFDFRDVTFMDSSGIGVIMGRCKLTKALGGKVIIYGAHGNALRILSMAGIEDLVVMTDSIEEGMKEACVNV